MVHLSLKGRLKRIHLYNFCTFDFRSVSRCLCKPPSFPNRISHSFISRIKEKAREVIKDLKKLVPADSPSGREVKS